MPHYPDEFQDSSINFWPAIVDMLAATLMVFVLATYVQATLALDDPAIMELRERQGAFIKDLKTRLSAELTDGTLCFQSSSEAILIRFSDNVLFEAGDFQLKRSGKRVLKQFGDLLSITVGSSVQRIQVEGHTDSYPFRKHPGSADYPKNNWQLSSARATSVVLFLSSQVPNLPERLFSANGFASFQPIADNTSAAGRSMNRRVEIRLLFSNDDNETNGGVKTLGWCSL